MNDAPALPNRTLGESITQEVRRMLVEGELVPGQRLSEAALAESLNISRNTLREAFRVLTREGLLKHEPNRGVTVAEPDMASIIDIYRVRRFIECKAIAQGYPQHPGTLHMREAVEAGIQAREAKDWKAVGTANMMFHRAIIELADSPRLAVFYGQISAELRLAFGLLNNPQLLHLPFLDMNASILRCLEEGRADEASTMLGAYLEQSERVVLAAYERTMSR
ncbi:MULTISPECIES: GntR family transcriptional regulator [Pseudomonas]|uniref:GntR family transcriptional regulator n=1 Tax=Pseudomonas folii TaxID=2762593 RepID=A0ABR7B119_9PSED|nr:MULTISPECIES: GntR family transcriptional regulator [Pseudomonas]MBC3950880.1 GntR family transcriptional regulator [Pseudomonas folii]